MAGIRCSTDRDKLGQGDDRTAQFPRQVLERTADVAHLLRAVLPACSVGHFDELQIVDDQQVETEFHLLPAGLAAEIRDRRIGIIVNIEGCFLRPSKIVPIR